MLFGLDFQAGNSKFKGPTILARSALGIPFPVLKTTLLGYCQLLPPSLMMIDVITGQSKSVSRVSKNEAVLKKAFGHFTPAFYQWPYGMLVCCGSKAYVIELIKNEFHVYYYYKRHGI